MFESLAHRHSHQRQKHGEQHVARFDVETALVDADGDVLDSRSTRQPRERAGRDEKMLSAEPKDRPKEEDTMQSN